MGWGSDNCQGGVSGKSSNTYQGGPTSNSGLVCKNGGTAQACGVDCSLDMRNCKQYTTTKDELDAVYSTAQGNQPQDTNRASMLSPSILLAALVLLV
jgi:hypothetical protein